MMKHQQVGELTAILKVEIKLYKVKGRSCLGNILKCCTQNSTYLLPSQDCIQSNSVLIGLSGAAWKRKKSTDIWKKLHTLAENHCYSVFLTIFQIILIKLVLVRGIQGFLVHAVYAFRRKSCAPLHSPDGGKTPKSPFSYYFCFYGEEVTIDWMENSFWGQFLNCRFL